MATIHAFSRWHETSPLPTSAKWPANAVTGAGYGWPSRWGALALSFGLGWAYPTRAQELLEEVNRIFPQRLETTCRYLEALEPLQAAHAMCFLQVGRRQLLLASLHTRSADKQRVREVYGLVAQPHDTVSVSAARYTLSPPVPHASPPLRLGLFHAYPTPTTVEAGQVLVQAEFSPLALLSLQPGTARAGQRVWVQNAAPDLNGDTLACYELLPSQGLARYRMVLCERRSRGNRHWRHNNRPTYEWAVDLGQRQIHAVHMPGDTRALHWERRYSSATDFAETCTGHLPAERGTFRPHVYTLYTRNFTQVTGQEARDTYTLPNVEATEPSRTFSLLVYAE